MRPELFKKYVSSSIMICYRSVVRHPFLIGMIIVLISIYRLFPLLFSLLLSASPVIVSTAVLLGTLLSYGQPNIPEIETESKSELDEIRKLEAETENRDEIQILETKVMSRTEIVGRDGSFASGETNESGIEVEKTSVNDDNSVNLVDDDCKVLQFGEEQLVEEEKNEMDEDKIVLGSHYSPLQQSEDDNIVLESDDKLWEGSADPLNSNSGLLWKRVEGDDDYEDDEGSDSGDSGSDLAESSSPDASMADIIPMLDELHPLLSEEPETHQAPEHSLESSDTSSASNDDDDDDDDDDDNDGGGIENHEDLEVGDDDDDDDDEGKETELTDKQDEIRSAITWTEYDQKNLMDLGTSEMERNRRLENLIARRRARKTMRMQAEKNLIDLESADLPWNIPPISTSRINPFDYDSNDNIPGSAPSILLQRRNPFDLPYDSSEEKPDLVGDRDTFQQEFAGFQPKEHPFFRRHESFNVGPSNLGASRSERQETKLRPYFVPERIASDGSSFSTFQRQFSGLTESGSSVGDFENKDHIEDDNEHASEMISDHVSPERPYFLPESSFQRQLSEVSESKVSSVPDSESVSSASDLENKDQIEVDFSQEPDLISLEEHELVSEHVSQGIEPYDGDNVESDQSIQALKVGEVLDDQKLDSSVSSLSSSDEVSDQIYNEKQGDEVVASVSETTNYFVDRGNSIESSDIDITSLLVEVSQPKEPVYDSSPRAVTRNLSSSSISNDLQASFDRNTDTLIVQHNLNELEVNMGPSMGEDHLHKDESFQQTEDQHHSSSSVADVTETRDAESQLLTVPDNEEPLLVDNVSTLVPNKPRLETEDVLLDIDASHQLEQVQVPSLSDARAHEIIHQEEVISQPEKESLAGRSVAKPLVEDHEELQDHELDQGQVTSSYSESQFAEVVHGETYEGEAISQPHKEDTFLNNHSEENLEVFQVQITSNNSKNLQIQEPENTVSPNINSVSSAEADVVEIADIESKAPGSLAYANDIHSNEINNLPNNIDGIDEIKDIDESFLVELDAVGDFSVKDLGSTLNEMKQDPHGLDHDLETNRSVDEVSYSKDLGSTLNEMKQDPLALDHDLETKLSGDEDSNSMDLGLTLDEMKQDPNASDHDLEAKRSGDEDSDSKDLGSTLNEMKQDPHGLDHDLETKISGDEDSVSKDLGLTLDEMKQDPHASDHDLEAKRSGDEDSYFKDLGSTLHEMKQEPHTSDHDLEFKRFGDEDSEIKNLGSTLNEMKQDPHDLEHDLETKLSVGEDSDSKDLGSSLNEMKEDPHAPDHDLETKLSVNEDSDSKDLGSTVAEMKQDIHVLEQDIETKRSEDEDSYSKDLGSTLNEMKDDPHGLDHDLETNRSVDEDSYSKDLESTWNEMRQGPQASEHRLETFYSVDENFYSKQLESTLNEMKLDPHDDTYETQIKTDAQELKSQNDKEISNTKVAETKLISNANEVVLPLETESMVYHGTENASSSMIKE